jgi:hypothetical protein
MCLISKKIRRKRVEQTDMQIVSPQTKMLEAISLSTKTLGRYVVTVNQWNNPTKMSPPTIKDDENMSSGRSMDANS